MVEPHICVPLSLARDGVIQTTEGAGDLRGAWGEIFRGGLGLYSALIIGGVATQAIQMPVIAIIIPTIVADIGSANYCTCFPNHKHRNSRDAQARFGGDQFRGMKTGSRRG